MERKGSWHVEFTISVNGQDVDFEDLSEETQKYITEQILDGYVGGWIEEEVDNWMKIM